MAQLQDQPASDPGACLGALIVSEVRFLRECLTEILQRTPGIEVRGQSEAPAQALAMVAALRPEIVLLDVAFPGGPGAAIALRSVAPDANVIALAVIETEESIFAWAEAGIAGYVPNTASLDELAMLIGQISRGEQTCTARIAGSLLRRISAGRGVSTHSSTSPLLTRRENEILELVEKGLSNKDIARRLGISLGTTKTHVHNLLGKLSFRRRTEAITHMRAVRHTSDPTFA